MTKPKTARWVGWYRGQLNKMFFWRVCLHPDTLDANLQEEDFVTKRQQYASDRRIEIIVRELPKKRKEKK